MKKTMFFLMVGFVFLGTFSAQNVNAQTSNDAQLIVGTWLLHGTGTGNQSDRNGFVFNANGTVTFLGGNSPNNENRYRASFGERANYFISNQKLIIRGDNNSRPYIVDYFLSADGRVLVLPGAPHDPVRYGFIWLNKQ